MIKVAASDHFDTVFSKIALQDSSGTRLTTLVHSAQCCFNLDMTMFDKNHADFLIPSKIYKVLATNCT